jgi:hypothetical protein
MALLSRLFSTCFRRMASPATQRGRLAAPFTRNFRPLRVISGRHRRRESDRAWRRLKAVFSTDMRPASRREKSSRSFSRVRIRPPASAISWAWILELASGTSLCRRAAPARMALIGVRSSWLIIATKADLAATASSASWRRRSASALASASAFRAALQGAAGHGDRDDHQQRPEPQDVGEVGPRIGGLGHERDDQQIEGVRRGGHQGGRAVAGVDHHHVQQSPGQQHAAQGRSEADVRREQQDRQGAERRRGDERRDEGRQATPGRTSAPGSIASGRRTQSSNV